MKVLDLQCTQLHVFEGWFASEDDFVSQQQRALVQCPVCGDASITKRLSAPRLNLGGTQERAQEVPAVSDPSESAMVMQTALMALARHVLANTTDVGDKFAEEARKIHYGESAQRNIRGEATRAETQALADEGIEVMPLLLPAALKGPLQ
jgi:hypothetical protein